MEIISRHVDFAKYCKTCKYENKPETEEPCNRCLSNYCNANTDKPIKWEERYEYKTKVSEVENSTNSQES